MKAVRLTVLVLSLTSAPMAAAEKLYVTDQLRLGVHALPDTSDAAFTNLNSGDAVELLEQGGSYARVRLADGREGWVRRVFLVADAPATVRIQSLEAERAELEQQLAEANEDAPARIAELEQISRDAQTRLARRETQIDELRAANLELRAQRGSEPVSMPIVWAVVVAFGAFFTGILLAWIWFDRRSRRRHGGFRIY